MPEDTFRKASVNGSGCRIERPRFARRTHRLSGTDLRLLNEFRTPAQVRLIFDEFFWLECGLRLKKTRREKLLGLRLP